MASDCGGNKMIKIDFDKIKPKNKSTKKVTKKTTKKK